VSFGNVRVDRWIMREFVVPSVFFDKAKGPDTAKINAAVPEIEKCLSALQTAVAETGHLAGTDLTFADMNVLPMLVTLGQFPKGASTLAKFAGLSSYISKLSLRPSFVNTAPPPRA
jgi:glutathione S-transferase